jgi:hypothetical protein
MQNARIVSQSCDHYVAFIVRDQTLSVPLIGIRSLFTMYRLDSSPVLLSGGNVVLIADKIVHPQASEVVRLIWGSGVASQRTCIRWQSSLATPI